MICCIDSNTFIWGIKRKAEAGQEDMILRAEHLFEFLSDQNHQILIPTVVIAEILAPEPLEKYPILTEIINKNFMVVDFDMRAASQYGILFLNRLSEVKKRAKRQNVSTQKMKIDHLIIACAIIHGASCIYTTDKGLKAFGEKYIDIRDLPPVPPPKLIQTSMFDQNNSGEVEDLPF